MRGRGHRQQKEKGEEEKEINFILSIYCDVVAAKCSYEHLVTVSGRMAEKKQSHKFAAKNIKKQKLWCHISLCVSSPLIQSSASHFPPLFL